MEPALVGEGKVMNYSRKCDKDLAVKRLIATGLAAPAAEAVVDECRLLQVGVPLDRAASRNRLTAAGFARPVADAIVETLAAASPFIHGAQPARAALTEP